MVLESLSTNQWIILLLVLVLGWLLGLMSRSGGKKWRRQYEAERDQRIAIERDRDERLAAADARWAGREGAPVVGDGVHRSGGF